MPARYNTNKEDMKPPILVVGLCVYESTEQMEQVFRDVQQCTNYGTLKYINSLDKLFFNTYFI